MNIYGEYFYGNKISDYGIEHGFVDYRTLAKAFDAVMCDMEALNAATDYDFECTTSEEYYEDTEGNVYTYDEAENKKEELQNQIDDLEADNEHGEHDDEITELENEIETLEEPHYNEIFQYFIVSANGAEILEEAGEIVYYSNKLDLYVWGVTHCGTSWDYVLTNIPCNTGKTE